MLPNIDLDQAHREGWNLSWGTDRDVVFLVLPHPIINNVSRTDIPRQFADSDGVRSRVVSIAIDGPGYHRDVLRAVMLLYSDQAMVDAWWSAIDSQMTRINSTIETDPNSRSRLPLSLIRMGVVSRLSEMVGYCSDYTGYSDRMRDLVLYMNGAETYLPPIVTIPPTQGQAPAVVAPAAPSPAPVTPAPVAPAAPAAPPPVQRCWISWKNKDGTRSGHEIPFVCNREPEDKENWIEVTGTGCVQVQPVAPAANPNLIDIGVLRERIKVCCEDARRLMSVRCRHCNGTGHLPGSDETGLPSDCSYCVGGFNDLGSCILGDDSLRTIASALEDYDYPVEVAEKISKLITHIPAMLSIVAGVTAALDSHGVNGVNGITSSMVKGVIDNLSNNR